MADASVAVRDANGVVKLVDNASATTAAGEVYRQRVEMAGAITKATATVTGSGATTIITPASGKKVRLYKVAYSADGGNAAGTVVSLSFGDSAAIDRQWLDPKQPYADSFTGRFVDGAADEALKVTLSAAVSVGVYVNVAYEEISA